MICNARKRKKKRSKNKCDNHRLLLFFLLLLTTIDSSIFLSVHGKRTSFAPVPHVYDKREERKKSRVLPSFLFFLFCFSNNGSDRIFNLSSIVSSIMRSSCRIIDIISWRHDSYDTKRASSLSAQSLFVSFIFLLFFFPRV